MFVIATALADVWRAYVWPLVSGILPAIAAFFQA